jgi:hypothetical protein
MEKEMIQIGPNGNGSLAEGLSALLKGEPIAMGSFSSETSISGYWDELIPDLEKGLLHRVGPFTDTGFDPGPFHREVIELASWMEAQIERLWAELGRSARFLDGETVREEAERLASIEKELFEAKLERDWPRWGSPEWQPVGGDYRE